MLTDDGERLLELEEEAQGVELYRTPGSHLVMEEARDEAEAAGWVPPAAPTGTTPLGRIRARRHDLRASMEYVEFVIARPSSTERWVETVEAALLRLRGALVRHIAEAEAPEGLLAEIVEASPRLGPEVREVEAEHGELVASLERALQALDAKTPVETRLVRRRVVSLLGRLALHRQRGADLVYAAYNVDIAAGD